MLDPQPEPTSLSQEEKNVANKAAWTKWVIKYQARLQKEEEAFLQNETEKGEEEEVLKKFYSKRQEGMDAVNPKFVLRNYVAEVAIRAAEKGMCTLRISLYPLSSLPLSTFFCVLSFFALPVLVVHPSLIFIL